MEHETGHRRIIGHMVAVCCALGFFSLPILAQEDEIWQMEEAYWRYVEAGDVESYTNLWHPDFVGWPCGAEQPTGKANIAGIVRAVRDQEYTLTYELNREATEYFGDVAVAHYSALSVRRYPDGRVTGEGRLLKLTHTWIRSADEWQIITGMCAVLSPAAL